MPQITCPNCGRTITLENRRKVDFDLIVTAVKREPRNFSDLLRITRLSRKTLSLRLKHMCESGILVKRDGKYNLNGDSHAWDGIDKPVKRLTKIIGDRRTRMGLALVSLMVLSSVSGYGLATLLDHPEPGYGGQNSAFLGNFTMAVDINDVNNLYGWQVVISYNATELTVLENIPGDFLNTQFVSRNIRDATMFLNRTMIEDGTLLLGGCLLGQVPGVNGSGRLAIITFAYSNEEYAEPRLVRTAGPFDTMLLNPRSEDIPITNSTLTLSLIEKH